MRWSGLGGGRCTQVSLLAKKSRIRNYEIFTEAFYKSEAISMTDQELTWYVEDTFRLLAEYARAAKKRHEKETDEIDTAFKAGYLSAYHDVISLLQSQARVFDIPLEDLKLDDIDPDTELQPLINR